MTLREVIRNRILVSHFEWHVYCQNGKIRRVAGYKYCLVVISWPSRMHGGRTTSMYVVSQEMSVGDSSPRPWENSRVVARITTLHSKGNPHNNNFNINYINYIIDGLLLDIYITSFSRCFHGNMQFSEFTQVEAPVQHCHQAGEYIT